MQEKIKDLRRRKRFSFEKSDTRVSAMDLEYSVNRDK